jgi:hypothetical protein
VVFSNKPTLFFDASFKIIVKASWDELKLASVRIVEFWDLFETLDFSDNFRRALKKEDNLVYESPIMSPKIGHYTRDFGHVISSSWMKLSNKIVSQY